MAAKLSGTWVDRLTPAGVFALALSLHLLVGLLCNRYLTPDDGPMLLWFATGVSPGLALAADLAKTRWAAMFGGLVGHLVYAVTADAGVSAALSVVSHLIEATLAGGLLLLLLTTWRSKSSAQPTSLLAMGFCIFAGIIAALPVNLPGGSVHTILQWGVGHGIGMFATVSILLLGRLRWLGASHPSEHRAGPLGAFALNLAIALATVYLEHSLLFVGLGSCLLLASRFGARVGQPAAVIYVVLTGIAETNGIGDFGDKAAAEVNEFLAFAGTIVMLAAMVGTLAARADRRVRKEQAVAGQWQKLAGTGFDGYIEIDAHNVVEDVSDSITTILGWRPEDVRGMPFRALFDYSGWAKILPFVRMVLGGESVRFDRSYQTANGETRWALIIAEPRMTRAGNYDGCTLNLLDTTSIHRSNAERARWRADLAEAQEVERLRLAHLVHDGALQDLAAANLLIGAARIEAGHPSPPAALVAAHLERVETLLVSGMRKLRADAIGSAVIDLRDTNVVGALNQTVAKFASVNSANVQIRERGMEDLSPNLERLVFQISREALVNAMVHSQATLVTVELRRTRDGCSVAIVDNGIGFDQNRLQEVGHLGLSTMTALAFEAGGWCALSTRPGRGTSVEAWVPSSCADGDAVTLVESLPANLD